MPKKRTVSLAMAIILLVIGAAAGAGVTYVGLLSGGSIGGLCSSGRTLTIGLLTDLSDGLTSQGVRAKDAALLAINDINTYLSNGGCNLKFGVSVDDYALDQAKALSGIQSFHASGVQVVVGPLNSGAAQNILQYANSNHIVMISPSSTSVALAIAGDYLFRTAPNDRWQGSADAQMMWSQGARSIIIVQRHDTYGDALANATAKSFQALGGNVNATIQYDQNAGAGFDFTSVLSTLNTDYNNANTGANHNKVAMDFISFEEFGQLIIQANAQHPGLLTTPLPWFGTDGEAQDTVISGNATAGSLVAKVKLPSTIYGFPNTTLTQTLENTFSTTYSGNVCDNYCRGTYDDMWLGALATMSAGAYDGTKIQAIMLQVADSYYGVTGWTGLEASGDRVASIYQIYEVKIVGTTPTWVYAGFWDAPSNTLTWQPGAP
jgi:branched-chain amino acid transport system substrate-binding protein